MKEQESKSIYVIAIMLTVTAFVCTWLIGYAIGRMDCRKANKYVGYETDDTHYYNGQILLPDYVHLDTLVVTDAFNLNNDMAAYDPETDADIYDILFVNTEKYKP